MKNSLKICVISPKCSKESAEHLAESLGAEYSPADKYDYSEFDVVINYGSSNVGLFNKVINNPTSVKICVNKISTLKRVAHGVQWTKDPEVAKKWLKIDGAVVARATETGSKSEGATICCSEEVWRNSPAKFWTRYFDHDHEVRVNVYRNKVISVCEKIIEDGEFTFIPLDITGEHPQVKEMVNSIKENIGIDFYGMDVLVDKYGECRLLEVNSGASILNDDVTADRLVAELRKEFRNHA